MKKQIFYRPTVIVFDSDFGAKNVKILTENQYRQGTEDWMPTVKILINARVFIRIIIFHGKWAWHLLEALAFGNDKKKNRKPQFSCLLLPSWLPEEEVWASDTKVVCVLAPPLREYLHVF